jgi:hypothetical protein
VDTLIAGRLALTGGTLTGALSLGTNTLTAGAITSSGNLILRNGLTPMQAEIFGTISGTSWESLCLKATATAHQIGSTVGTGGGTNRPVQLGHFNSAGAFTTGLSVGITGVVEVIGNAGWGYRFIGGGNCALHASGGATTIRSFSGNDVVLIDDNQCRITRAIVASSDLTFIPTASRTLATNGQMSFERTSNTTGNIVVRGDDGVTRRMALTFV